MKSAGACRTLQQPTCRRAEPGYRPTRTRMPRATPIRFSPASASADFAVVARRTFLTIGCHGRLLSKVGTLGACRWIGQSSNRLQQGGARRLRRIRAEVRGQILVASDRRVWHSVGKGCSRGAVSLSGKRIDPQQAILFRDSEAVAEGNLAKIPAVRAEDVVALAFADMATVAAPQILAVEIAEVLTTPSPQVRHG